MDKNINQPSVFKETSSGWGWLIPESKKATCLIREIYGNTGRAYLGKPFEGGSDLNHDIHEGFTIGNGKQLYWEMIWHSHGNVTVINKRGRGARWLQNNDEQLITIHFK